MTARSVVYEWVLTWGCRVCCLWVVGTCLEEEGSPVSIVPALGTLVMHLGGCLPDTLVPGGGGTWQSDTVGVSQLSLAECLQTFHTSDKTSSDPLNDVWNLFSFK